PGQPAGRPALRGLGEDAQVVVARTPGADPHRAEREVEQGRRDTDERGHEGSPGHRTTVAYRTRGLLSVAGAWVGGSARAARPGRPHPRWEHDVRTEHPLGTRHSLLVRPGRR